MQFFVKYFVLVIQKYYNQSRLLDYKNNYRSRYIKMPSKKIKVEKTIKIWANKQNYLT